MFTCCKGTVVSSKFSRNACGDATYDRARVLRRFLLNLLTRFLCFGAVSIDKAEMERIGDTYPLSSHLEVVERIS